MNTYWVGVTWRPKFNSLSTEFHEFLVKARNRDQALFTAGRTFAAEGYSAMTESIQTKVTRKG